MLYALQKFPGIFLITIIMTHDQNEYLYILFIFKQMMIRFSLFKNHIPQIFSSHLGYDVYCKGRNEKNEATEV